MARLYSTAAPRSCGRHWTMIFRRRRSSLIRTFRWMKSSTILRFLFQDCGRSMFSVRATPERQRYSFAISCWTRIILFITGYCTSAALLKNRKKWTLTLEKVNIENKKVNIEEDFTAKTASAIELSGWGIAGILTYSLRAKSWGDWKICAPALYSRNKHNIDFIFQKIKDRNPVFICGFHTDIMAIIVKKPLTELPHN